MIAVTTPAKELLRDIDLPEDTVLRLDPSEHGRLAFVSGPAQPDDQVVDDGGQELLHIAGLVSQQLDGHRLDRIDTNQGPQLTLRAPNDGSPVV